LTYFDIRGRGELARWILLQGGVDFEDCRDVNWQELKPKTILGFLPQLEKGDWIIAQTGAVNRACAKMANLEGKDAMECAKADMIYECSRDLFDEMARGKFEKNECLQKGLLMNWEEKVFPNFCEKMSCFLDKNGGKYFVGNQVTWADLAVAGALDSLMIAMPVTKKCLEEKYKPLLAHHAMITALPKIKAHIDTRKQTTL